MSESRLHSPRTSVSAGPPSPHGVVNGALTHERQRPAAESNDLSRRWTWSLLSSIVALSFVARLAALWGHTTPRYFPDEYIYAALGQSLARGQLMIRDGPANFPALLEPLLAAPLWALFSLETAYRLVQAQNALAMSLAAIPVFYLARRVGLSSRYSLGCAAFAVVIPDFVFSAYTIADPVAYPLVVAAVAAGVHALATGSARAQLLFVALAGLSSFAKVQYVVLFAAFIAGALLLERLHAFKKYRVTVISLAVPLAIVTAAGPSRLLGYYSGIADLSLNTTVVRWFGLHLFLLTLVAGVALVPGAIVALARPNGRIQSAFSAFTVALTAFLIVEAALYAGNGPPRFKERYLFVLLPLIPIAFGLYLKNGRPHRRIVVGIALVVAVAVARLPLSAYSAGDGRSDSPFLGAVSQLDALLGAASGSLIVAALATAAAAASALVAWRRAADYILPASLVAVAVISFGAVKADLRSNRLIEEIRPQEKSWVDSHALGDVTVIQTINSPRRNLLSHLFWNTSVRHQVVLPGASASDAFRAPALRIGRDGSLLGITGAILFNDFGTTGRFADAELVERNRWLTLWRPRGPARLRLLITGRYWDGWLSQRGVIQTWPTPRRDAKTLSFQLSLPTRSAPVRMSFGSRQIMINPGDSKNVLFELPPSRHFVLAFDADRAVVQADYRALSVRMTNIRFGT